MSEPNWKPSRGRGAVHALALAVGMLFAASSAVWAAVPGQVNYQGLLLDDLGTPIDGTAAMTFSLFDADSGGTQLWTETHPTVSVVDGVYDVALGSITPLDGSVLAGAAVYLEITVDGDTLSPRQRLLAVPYALVAESANSIDGVPDEYVSQMFLHTNFDGGPPNDDPREGFADTDGDSILNFIDADNDNDGISDSDEVSMGWDINLVTPTITGLSPDTNAVLTSTVTISGTSFEPGMSVAFGSENPVPFNVTPTSAQVDVGPQAAGPAVVTVTLANGEDATDGSFDFLCLPDVVSVNPTQVPVSTPTLVSVSGADLELGYTVTVDGVPVAPSNQTLTGFDVVVDSIGTESVDIAISYPNGCADSVALQVPALTIFATSTAQSGNLGGLSGADAVCQARATAAGLEGPSDYLAWLADGTDGPDSRFSKHEHPHRLTTGTLIANDWTDLTDGSLLAPIDRTESGGLIPSGNVWTNVATDGSNAGNGSCSDWTVTAGGAGYGILTATDSTWTDAGTLSCTNAFRLYCVEQQ